MRGILAMRGIARAVALLTLGALALHQLRYSLVFGDAAPNALHHHGHDYLIVLAPALVALAVALAVAGTIARAAALRGGPTERGGVMRRALLFGAALLAVYSAQELTEGTLAAGHPSGTDAMIANGGWIAVPLALLLGLATALVARLLERVEEQLASASPRASLPRPPAALGSLRATTHVRSPLAALAVAFGLARRPPPAPQVR
jgi:hypothetical protein